MTQWKMTPNPTTQRNSNCDSLDYDDDGSHCVINQWQVGRTAYGLNNTKGHSRANHCNSDPNTGRANHDCSGGSTMPLYMHDAMQHVQCLAGAKP